MIFSFRQKISKAQYIYLKTLFKKSAEVGSILRQSAQTEKDCISRYTLRNIKRAHGQKTRTYLLALAFLRGRKYDDIEPNCQNPAVYLKNEIKNIVLNHCYYSYAKRIDDDLKLFFTPKETKEKAA